MKTYLVGGAVRDTLLGYPHDEHDWVVVGATPEDMIAAGYKPVGKDFPVFLHPETNEEYALARTERKTAPGYRGFAVHSSPDVTLEEDLLRRDLTINAIARDSEGNLIDPYHGQRDIEQRVLRHVSPAFAEDPLRVLRIARFAARYYSLGFCIAPETSALMRTMTDNGEIDALVPERVWKEMQRALSEPNPEQFFFVLRECGALARLMPELETVTAVTWQALSTAAAQRHPDTTRFAMLAAELNDGQTRAWCERLRAPNDFRELALMVSKWQQNAANAASPDAAMRLLEDTDALRRPDRFNEWLQACAVLQIPAPQLQRLQRAQQAASVVNAQVYLTQGLSGKALGEAIQQGRMAAVQASWN
jgi:tRNA nucleotidyltransferase (CCA-adding enzyme)